MRPKFQPPRRWQDWTSWTLGIWLILSPWVLMFWPQKIALENATVCGALLILVEVITLTTLGTWEEGVNVVLGAWLVVSPFVLRIGNFSAIADFIAVGVLVVLLAFNEMREIARYRQTSP